MADKLASSIKAFQSTLSQQEQSELSTMERAAMIAETRDLLNKSRRNKGGSMGMNRQAQAQVPASPEVPQGAPKMGQEVTTKPVVPGAPLPDANAKAGQAPPAQTPMPPAPAAPVTAEPSGPSEGIDTYLDNKEEQQADDMSSNEMGIKDPGKVAAFVEAYGHLRIRPTVKNAVEVYDPANNQALMLVRPNEATRKNAQMLRKCAVEVLKSIGQHGLVKTAQLWKAQIKRADGGVVDYGASSQQVKPKFSDDSINDRGETSMQQDITLGVDSTTGEGDNLTTTEKPETRKPAGLSGKAAQKVPTSGGSLPGHETNMADPPAKSPEGDALSALKNEESNMKEKHPTKDKGTDSTLDDAVTTFANETLTANRRRAQAFGEPPMGTEKDGGCGGFEPKPKTSQGMPAQTEMGLGMEAQMPGSPPPPPPPPATTPQTAEPDPGMAPPAPGMGPDVLEEDVETMTEEQKIARLYRKRAEKQVAENTRKFIARFVRCVRIAARRQALNLEPNQLKIAVADALMSPAALSKHEAYAPMDARTATFVIERGLDQRNALAFVDSLIKRSASFMRMADEALTQVEEDLENIQPVAPTEKGAQMTTPGQPSVMPGMPQMADEDPDMNPEMVPGMDGDMPGGEMPMGMEAQEEDPAVDPSMMGMEAQDEDPGIAGMPTDMQMNDEFVQTEEQRAAAIRRRASNGNLPINPGIGSAPAVPQNTSKRDQVRFAVGATKSAGLHNFFGGRR